VTHLIDAMLSEGERLKAAARAIGGTIKFDPHLALTRDGAPNRNCRLIKAGDGWIAVNLARDEDREAVPAWIGCALNGEPWGAIIEAARRQSCAELLDQAILLGMPVSVVGESLHTGALLPARPETRSRPTGMVQKSAVDLSALWAGPYCGGLLAEAGLRVTKIESPARPDTTPVSSPMLNRRLNGQKRHLSLDLKSAELAALIANADLLITSARPNALARLGLTEGRLFAVNPALIWVAITAYGWTGDAAMRVGFGDDCAAAGGLVDWSDGTPLLMGDALADPLTGMTAATLAMEALADGRAGLIDVALAPTAARFAS
jgi:CoA-transferase family III